MSNRRITNKELAARKHGQAVATRTTSALGLGGLGMLAVSHKNIVNRPGVYRALKKVPKLNRAKSPAEMGEKLRTGSFATGSVAGGIGALAGFNAATIADADRKKMKVSKSDLDVPTFGDEGVSKRFTEEIAKIGEWKSIDQRETTQRRDRKAQRYAGAGVGLGVGTIAGTHTKRDRRQAKFAALDVKNALSTKGKKSELKYAGRLLRAHGSLLSTPVKAGGALVAGSAVLGTGAKGHQTYQQHKINERRRNNYKDRVKKDWSPSASKFDPEGRRMKRTDKYPKLLAGASAAAGGAAGYSGLQSFKAHALANEHARRQRSVHFDPTKSTHHKTLRAASKASKVKAGKLAVVAVGAGGAAGVLHRKKNSDSWKPYVSKSVETSAFGIRHD